MKSTNSQNCGRINVTRRAAPQKSLAPAQLQAVAGLFGALSEQSRLQILQALKDGPMSVNALVERTGLKQANVSKQLGLLQSASIIDRRQDGNHAFYSIKLPLVFDLCRLVCDGIAKQATEFAAALHT
jgi:DNA-binding transcriptional ArsR family regulator